MVGFSVTENVKLYKIEENYEAINYKYIFLK